MSFAESINKFEVENNFQFGKHINGKRGFNLIEGFYNAFVDYKVETQRIESLYFDFFNGKTYNKIEIEYDRVQYNSSWFLNIFSQISEHYYNKLNIEEAKLVSKYKIEIMNFSFACLDFSIKNFNDLSLYNYYFFRLDNNVGFNYDSYITFIEFKQDWKLIEKMDKDDFIRWHNAQKLM
ncbi:hypothetical protein GOQ30_02295 [Flavobacterium sp. TP390]|uniref:Uncharacterized protein n=1 Tax=Flavobacterium profundi TaxID=1774945 RepID=A0A6I4IEJ5_9FLAO|nr:hypothetical protein [Flavobacterium profundi]MVO07995.1 hypothetical protein [Flavobacterium profundi]